MTSSATDNSAGITATQNTARKSLAPQQHQRDREQRAERGADRVERLAQPEGRHRAAAGGAMSATSASRGAPRMPLPTRSSRRARSTSPALDRRARTAAFDSARQAITGHAPAACACRARSDSAPENTLTISAVASRRAFDAGRRVEAAGAERADQKRRGSRLWTISDDTSISRLTKPSAQMLRGTGGIANGHVARISCRHRRAAPGGSGADNRAPCI